MAKQTTPKPKAIAPAAAVAPAEGAEPTETKIEGATAQAEGNPMPPAMGNEGTAAAAGEGQPSLANLATEHVAQDGVSLEAAKRAVNDAILSAQITDPGGPSETAEPSLVVIGPKKGRWRIGRKFGPEPVTLLASDLSEAEMKALAEDLTLTVTAVAPPY